MTEKINELTGEPLQFDGKPKEFSMLRMTMVHDRSLKSDFVVNTFEKAIYVINDFLRDSPFEMLIGLALDSNMTPVNCCLLEIGSEQNIPSNLSKVFKYFLTSGGEQFALIHNHPTSRNLQFSNSDLNMINTINSIATQLNIRINDFVVVGRQGDQRAYVSYSEKRVVTQYQFLDTIKDLKNAPNVIDVVSNESGKLDVDLLSSKSKFNTLDSLPEEKSKKGFFGLFK